MFTRLTTERSPKVDEKLQCVQEPSNAFDRYAIVGKVNLQTRLVAIVVGHLPKEISRVTSFLMSRGATVEATVTDSRHRWSLIAQGGLEIPIRSLSR